MKKNHLSDYFLYILLVIILLFSSTYIFTRSAILDEFDFTKTGSIGDTIGGITAPIINILGAILIFISFKEQVKANKSLQNDIIGQTQDRNFQVSLELFKELKNTYKDLSYTDLKGQAALNYFVNEFDDIDNTEKLNNYMKKPIFFDWKYLLCEYDLLTEHILYSNMKKNERRKIFILIHNYYALQLEYSINIIKNKFEFFEVEDKSLELITKFKEIDAKFTNMMQKN
jgi:hypothetical protein